ncbi:phospho-sugar glycosidase domain-containing protein [Streptococcus suis]
MPRVVYKDASVPASSYQAIPVGRWYILIYNDLYGRYKGELQIALK